MDLGDVSRKLRTTEPQINSIVARHLRGAHAPVTLSIRRSVLSTPTHGDRHTGLRARIAGAVAGWSKETPKGAEVGVAVIPSRTFGEGDAYLTLPLYYSGGEAGARYARWRHPLFGDWEYPQQQPGHPYFSKPASLLSVTADIAARGAMQEITRDLS